MLTVADYIRRLDVVNRGFRYVSRIVAFEVWGNNIVQRLQHSSGTQRTAQPRSSSRAGQDSLFGTANSLHLVDL